MSQDRWKRQRRKRRYGHWDPYTKDGGIYEDVDASVQGHVKVENDVDTAQGSSPRESNRGRGVEQNAAVRGYWTTKTEENPCGSYVKNINASFRSRTTGAERLKEYDQDRSLPDIMRLQQRVMRTDLDRGLSSIENRNTAKKCGRGDENTKNCFLNPSTSVTRGFKELLPNQKRYSHETIARKKRAKNPNSENPTSCVKNAVQPKRVLQQCVSDRHLPNFDNIYDRPGHGTGKENVPPGAGEHCAKKVGMPLTMRKLRPKALLRLSSTPKPTQEELPTVEQSSYLNRGCVRVTKKRPNLATSAPKEQSSLEEVVYNDEDSQKSAACSHSKLCNWTVSASQIGQMASHSSMPLELPLSCGPGIDFCTTSTTKLTISRTHPTFKQMQNKKSLPKFSHTKDEAVVSLNNMVNRHFLSKLIRYLHFSYSFQKFAQYQYRLFQCQNHAAAQQATLPSSQVDRVQGLLYQSNDPENDIYNIAYLNHPGKVHLYPIILEGISPYSRGRLLRISCSGMQTHFLPSNTRNIQLSGTGVPSHGIIVSLSSIHDVKCIKAPTAARIAHTPPEYGHPRDMNCAIYHLPLKEQNINCLVLSTPDQHTLLLLHYATCVYIYSSINHLMQTILQLMSLALRRYLDIVLRSWCWSFPFC